MPTAVANLCNALTVFFFATVGALCERITLLERLFKDLETLVGNLKSAHLKLDGEVDNIHQFCEDLVEGRWQLHELFPSSLQINVDTHTPVIERAIGTGVDSSALMYASNFAGSACREFDSAHSFQPN